MDISLIVSPRSLNSPDSEKSEKEKKIDRIRAVCVGRNIRVAFCAADICHNYCSWRGKSMNAVVQAYLSWVKAYPILSTMIQFAILGTLGEVVSKWVVRKSFRYPFSFGLTLWKMIVWATLGVAIKYAFNGFTGYVEYLEAHKLLPVLSKFGKAFAISASMNLQFGVFLVLVHRLLDGLGERKLNWSGLDKSFYALLWFWIPAHTLTFMQAEDLRIGLAALLSVMLGLILGIFNRR